MTVGGLASATVDPLQNATSASPINRRFIALLLEQ